MEDERFSTNRARVQNRAQVVSELKEVFATRTAREWMDLCEQIGIPTAPINDMAQVFEDPQVQDREMLLDVPHAGGGSVPLVASPLKIPTAPVEVRYPPPLLGQHTDEILTSMLGLDAERIRQLREDGVI